jgi:DNA-binding NtrC family response regulator
MLLNTRADGPNPGEIVVEPRLKRLLLVDDDAHVSRALARVLRRFCDVEIVLSVEEAESRLAEGNGFDLILCDLILPERTGLDLYRGLVARGSEMASRMAFMTGLGDDAAEAEEFREVPCLGKPVDITRVRALLDVFS